MKLSIALEQHWLALIISWAQEYRSLKAIFRAVELGQSTSNAEYKEPEPLLRQDLPQGRLNLLHRKAEEKGVATLLVEWVEVFTMEEEWRRGYAEINDFEGQLIERGMVLRRFWIYITKDGTHQHHKAPLGGGGGRR